ncbi:MAG: DUF433 domain-containing protein [Cyanobacteria bacterium P01_H01_bin.119]
MSISTAKVYVEYRNEGYFLSGSRVSLDSIIYGFRNGDSPESIAQAFPTLTLEQVYGAIAFYLANRNEVDVYLAEENAAFDAMPQPLATDTPLLYAKLVKLKAQQHNIR